MGQQECQFFCNEESRTIWLPHVEVAILSLGVSEPFRTASVDDNIHSAERYTLGQRVLDYFIILAGDTDYVNCKGYASIQLQLVVDDNLVILDAYVGWPGCCHDARVFRNSPLFHRLPHDDGTMLGEDYFVIGE